MMKNARITTLIRHAILGITGACLLSGCVDRTPYERREQDEVYRGRAPEQAKMRKPIKSAIDHKNKKQQQAKAAKKKLTTPKTSIKVGVLAPLSGEGAEIGNMLVDAAMLALLDKYASLPPAKQRTRVILIPKDTAGTAAGAERAAQEAISEGAKLLIGPLYSQAARGATTVARRNNIPMITFSNNREVAETGVYIFGFVPGQQAGRIAEEAYIRGKKNLAVLAPNNSYGQEVATAVRKVAAMYGQHLAGIEFYPALANDVDIEIQRIFGIRGEKNKDPVDSLLIAEGGERLIHIAERLQNFGIDRRSVQFLGTGLWDDHSLIGHPLLLNGWFASSPVHNNRGFEQRFTNYYGYKPVRLASLSYDAVALAVTLANQPGGARFNNQTLTNQNGFRGPANGLFRCKENGTCERGLAVLQVGQKEFKEVAHAPRVFLKK